MADLLKANKSLKKLEFQESIPYSPLSNPFSR
jgi:hypothetical protein